MKTYSSINLIRMAMVTLRLLNSDKQGKPSLQERFQSLSLERSEPRSPHNLCHSTNSALHVVVLTCEGRKATQDVLSRRIDETTRIGSKNHESGDRGIHLVCPSSGGYETCGWNPHICVNTASTAYFSQIYVEYPTCKAK